MRVSSMGYDNDIELTVGIEAEDVKQSAERLSKEIDEALNSNNDSNDSRWLNLQNQMQKLKDSATQLSAKLTELENVQVPTERYIELQDLLTKIGQKFDAAQAKQEEMYEAGLNIGSPWEAICKTVDNLSDSWHKVNDEIKQLESSGNAWEKFKVPTEEYDKAVQKVKTLEDEYDRLWEKRVELKRSGDVIGYGWTENEKQIKHVTKALHEANAEARKLEDSGKAYKVNIDTPEYQKTSKQLEEVNNKMRVAIARANEYNTKLDKQESTLERTTKALKTYSNAFQALLRPFAAIVKASDKAFKSITKLAKNLQKTVSNSVKKGFKNLHSIMSKLNKVTQGSDFNFKKLFWTLMRYGVGIRSLYLLFRKLRSAITEGLKNMAQWRDGNNEVNHSISQLISSLNYLKNAWGAAFAPILNFVAPVLSRLMDLLANAGNQIGAFFAAITGKNTFIKAKKVMTDYAKSLNKTKDAAKEAREELASYDKLDVIKQDKDTGADDMGSDLDNMFEEVTIPDKIRELADKLRQLAKDDKWYEIGAEIAKRLNEGMKLVDDWINNVFRPWGVKWARRIAEVLNGIVDYLDWELLGKTIADGFNAIADIINTFLTTFNFENLGRGLGRAVKSWFDNIEWDLIGQTLANYFNATIDLFYGFIKEIQGFGPQVGQYLAEFWNNFVDTIHLDRLTEAVAIAINEFFGALGGFADANKWNEQASKVATAVKTFFDAMQWKENGINLTNFFNGLIESVWQFFYDMQSTWGEIGAGFAQFLGEIFTGANLQKAAETLAMMLNGLKDLVMEFATNFPWEEAGRNLGESINTFFASTDWEGKGKAANELIMGILTFVKTAVDTVDWHQIGEAIGTYLDQIDWSTIFWTTFDIITTILHGFIDGLLDTKSGTVIVKIARGILAIKLLLGAASFAGSIGKWITDVSPLLVKFSQLFGTGGPLNAIGSTIVGVLKPVGAVILAAIGGWQIGKGLSSILFKDWKEAFDQFSFKQLLIDLKDTFFGDLEVSWVGFTDYLYEQLSPGGKAMVDGLFGGIQAALDGIGGILTWLKEHVADPIINGVKSLFGIQSPSTVMAEIGDNIIAGLFEGISEKWEAVKGFFTESIPQLIEDIKGKWEELKRSTREKWEAIKTEIKGKWDTIKTALSNPNVITTKISTAFTTMKTKISSAWDSLKTKTSTAFNNMKTSMINAFENAKTKIGSLVESIKSKAESAWDRISTKANDLKDNLADAGRNVADGFAYGIEKASQTRVGRAVTGMVTDVRTKTRQLLKINSPSKVFEEIGRYISEGLAEGIEKDGPKVVNALQDTIKSLDNEAAKESVDFSLQPEEMITGLDSVIERLTKIANLFTNVTNAINNAASNIDIPDIVKGRVAPGNAITNDAQQLNMKELINMMQQFIDSMGTDNDSSNKEPIVLQLSGRQVAQVVWDENEKRYKQMNGYNPRFA